jgi:hypothetical protein
MATAKRNRATVRYLLMMMAKDGEIERFGDGSAILTPEQAGSAVR